MSQFNQLHVPTLSADQFILRGQRFNLQGAIIGGVPTSSLTTEVIINDDTKNQVLFEEIYGNIHGNTFPMLQAEIVALQANVALLQAEDIVLQNQITVINGNIASLQAEDINLQSQINLLTGNVVINANAIAELISDTQFLEAPYNGLAGNTSYFYRGLQVYNTATDAIDEINGTGIFSYLDGGVPTNQIQLRVQDAKNVLIAGGSQSLQPKSTGNVNVNNADGIFSFLVGDRTKTNFFNNSVTEINGLTNIKGQDGSYIKVWTQPAQTIPIPQAAVKRVDIRGDQEARILGPSVKVLGDGGAYVTVDSEVIAHGSSGGEIIVEKDVYVTAPGGSSPGSVNIQIGSCDLNTTGKINIGTSQGLTELGYKEIYIGQNGPPSAARKSSTLLDGDNYLPQNLVTSPNLGGWDNIVYLGIPTAYSGPLRGPVKNTYSPYVRSISTFSAAPTINSFVQSSGTFTVAVGLGAISLNAGAGGCLVNCAGGLIGLTSLIGGIGLTTAGGAIALTTGAGIIQMTTGAAPIAMETNIGDILLKAGYSNQSTPELSLGSVYLQARNYTYITPDQGVIVGEGIVVPFNETLLNTMNYIPRGNIFSNALISGFTGVYSNTFQTPNSVTTLLNPVTSNLIYSNSVYETGSAYALLRNMDINGTISTSSLAIVPAGNLGANIAITNYTTNFFFPDNTVLPLNANVKVFVYSTDLPNISNYSYSTWQVNANIASNISALVNGYVEPNPPSYENYMTVLGNVGILADLDVGANITVASSSFPLQQTLITRNSVTTTGDITCSTLNYSFLNPPVSGGGGAVDSIIAGTNISINPLNGQGNVVINCTLPNIAGVSQIVAGNGIQISPIIGTGVVTVELAGSVIPPGGYLPIYGGTMTGSIYQFPSSNIIDNTIKKYRPLTSYQPPFPSISTPSFTGELLTFFNGDNSPEQLNFTGWFPENMFQYQPDVITGNIPGGQNTFYSYSGGTNQALNGNFRTEINQFANGDHITGGSITIVSADADQTKLTLSIFSKDPGGAYNTLYQIFPPAFPPGGGTYNIPIDYLYTGGQTGQNSLVWNFDPRDDGSYPNFTIVGTSLGGNNYNFQGQLNLEGVGQSSNYIGVQGDPTTSVFYEYFPTTNLSSKLGAVFKTGGVGKIHGIYADDVATSRQIIVYGDFNTLITSGQQTLTFVFNNIFMYNVDTGIYSQLTTQTADPAYAGNLPKGLNGAVYGVEKQTSQTSIRNVWIWGDFTNVAQMGNPLPPTDSTVSCGINYTQTDNWGLPVSWGTTNPNNSLNGCRGGSIADDNPASPQSFALMVWATTRDGGNYRTISIAYYDTGNISATAYPFGNGNFGDPALTTNVVTRIDKVAWRTGPSTVFNQLVFCGSYIGVAQGGGNVDVPCYSLSSTQTTDNGWNPQFNPPWGNGLKILADSGNASFWYPNSILMGSYTYRVCTNGTINETAVIGTTGYSSTATNGGGVLTMNNNDFFVSSPTVNKFLIEKVTAYSVKNVIGIDPTAINLSCSLNEDNFWFGQTFNSTISPAPIPPTIPTVNAINGAKFLVNNTEMDKIVFSGGDTDFASVSFIAGSVEKGDPYWYWQSQVGALDYYDGATFYPNVTSSPPQPFVPGPTTSTWGTVLLNGNVASKGIDMNNFDITNANTIYSANILTLSAPNAVEVGVGTRRIQPVLTVILDTLGNNAESNFSTNYVISAHFSVTSPTYFSKNSLQGYFRFDDGMGGGFGHLTPSIYQQSTGILMATGTQTGISSGSGQNYTFSFPNDVLLPPTDTYYFTFTTDGQSDSYYFFGWQTADPNTVCSFAEAVVYASVSDPLDFFNVYGNTFVNDRITSYGDIFFENPSTSLVANVLIDKTGMTINNATDNTYINSTSIQQINTGNPGVSSDLQYYHLNMYDNLSYRTGQITASSHTLTANPPGYSNTNTMYIDGYRVQYYQYSQNSSQAQLIALSGSSQVFLSASQISGTPVGYAMTIETPISGSFKLACSTLGGSSNKTLDITNTGSINILTSNVSSSINLGYNTTLININNAFITATAIQTSIQTPTNNNSLTVNTASVFAISTDIDDINNPTLQIVNSNVSTTSYPCIKLQKQNTSTLVGNVISAVSSWARDYTNTSLEWSRIQTKVENNSVGNQDATLSIHTIVNGTLSEVFNFNGGQNEINSFRPLDMNGNDIRSTSGNLTMNATLSTGTGQVQIQTKPGTLGSGAGLFISGNTMTSTTAGGSSGHHMCITLPDPTTGLPRVYKIALLNP